MTCLFWPLLLVPFSKEVLICKALLLVSHVSGMLVNPRLLLSTILRSKPDAVFAFGVVCSTWVAVSRGSTHRHYFLPLGDPNSPSCNKANLLVARTGIPYI